MSAQHELSEQLADLAVQAADCGHWNLAASLLTDAAERAASPERSASLLALARRCDHYEDQAVQIRLAATKEPRRAAREAVTR